MGCTESCDGDKIFLQNICTALEGCQFNFADWCIPNYSHYNIFLTEKQTKKFHFKGFLKMVKMVKNGQGDKTWSKWWKMVKMVKTWLEWWTNWLKGKQTNRIKTNTVFFDKRTNLNVRVPIL